MPRSTRPAFLTLLALVALLTRPAPVDAQPVRTLTAEAALGDLRLLRRSLETVHPGYLRYATRRQLDTAWARLERRIAGGTTDAELYRETAALLALIRCNHTKAEFPAAVARWRDSAATFLPFRFRVVQGRMRTLTDIAGLPRGSTITRVNGMPADSVLGVLRRYVAVDGYTDHTRDALLAFDSDLMGSDFDHYYPVLFGAPASWTFDAVPASATHDAAPVRVSAAPIGFAAWKALYGPGVLRTAEFGSGVSWRMLDPRTAMLVVPSFVNYRTPVNADSLFDGMFSRIAARGATHLVVDLRANSGGSDDARDALLAHLTHRAVLPSRNVRQRVIRFGDLPQYVSTWGDRRAIFEPDSAGFVRAVTVSGDTSWSARPSAAPLTPARHAFRGNVTVLTSHQNASGATMLAAVLQELGRETGRLRLVGEATGGSAEGPTAGQILFVTLPASGVRVRLPVKQTEVGTKFVRGFGVFPDIEVAPSLDASDDSTLRVATATPFSHRTNAKASARTTSNALASLLIGTWRGALEYRDYGTDKRVVIPVTSLYARTTEPGRLGGWSIYDDGPGKTIVSRDWTRVDEAAGTWAEQGSPDESGAAEHTGENDPPSRYRMTRTSGRDGTVVTLLGTGTDNDQPVEVRHTIRVTGDSLTRVKEFRKAGGAWEFRHAYRYARDTR